MANETNPGYLVQLQSPEGDNVYPVVTAEGIVGNSGLGSGSVVNMTFDPAFVGKTWTLTDGTDETCTGTVSEILSASAVVKKINTTYTLKCELDSETYTVEFTTKAYYTTLVVTLEKFQSAITVTVDSGSTVTATLGNMVITKISNGTVVFTVGKAGTWAIKATKGDQTAEDTVNITASGQSKALTLSYVNVFGVCWDTSNSSTALTRLTPETDPYGLVTRSVTTEPKPAVGTGAGSSPFDSFMPWSDMKECNLNNEGAVTAWKGDSGFSRSNNFTMVFIPEFYVATKRDATKQYFYVSDKPKTGMTKHPGSGKYVGRYTIPGSKTGVVPTVNISRSTARSNAKKNGDKWRMYDFATYCAIIFLYIVEFADWNSQNKIAYGRANGQSSAVTSGKTDTMVYHTGTAGSRISDGAAACQYRWVENLWGNLSQWVDGFTANGTTAYYCTDPSKYADYVATGYNKIGTLPSVASGYIKDLTVLDNGLFIPKSNGGSNTTYIPDIVVSVNSGNYGLTVGGCYGENTDVGLLYFNASDAGTASYSTVSTRLMCEP